MTEVKAKLSFLRQSPRKVRLVADLVRGKKVLRALAELDATNKKATKPIKKLIESAVANAKNNFKLDVDGLIVGAITVDDGPTLKRWMPRARGRATTIRKRTSHVVVTLTTNQETEVKEEEVKKEKKETKKVEKTVKKEVKKEETKK